MIRAGQMETESFRRQHPAGPYILDFYCPRLRIAIEVDGGGHGHYYGAQRDAKRDAWLLENGVLVLRFWNIDVQRNLFGVCDTIRAAVMERGRTRRRSRWSVEACSSAVEISRNQGMNGRFGTQHQAGDHVEATKARAKRGAASHSHSHGGGDASTGNLSGYYRIRWKTRRRYRVPPPVRGRTGGGRCRRDPLSNLSALHICLCNEATMASSVRRAVDAGPTPSCPPPFRGRDPTSSWWSILRPLLGMAVSRKARLPLRSFQGEGTDEVVQFHSATALCRQHLDTSSQCFFGRASIARSTRCAAADA